MALASASKTSGHPVRCSDATGIRYWRRAHRHSLLPLPARSIPPAHKYSTTGNAPVQCRAAPSESDATPYFDALIRTFLLGVVSGGLFESYYALSTLWDVSAQTANVWVMAKAAYSPQFVEDHVFAVSLWFLLYASECFGASQASMGSLQSSLAALPKALIPVKFTALKTQLAQRLAKHPAGAASNKSAATATLEAPTDARGLGIMSPNLIGASTLGPGTAVEEDSPFVQDKAPRPGLAPGQWDPALGGAVQDKAAKQNYLEGMYYCIGNIPWNGLKEDVVYSAYVMGTRVVYWKGADDQVRTISSTCTHRGAQLANGWIDTIHGETCVRCPYHAWAYSGDGTVKDIPVQPEGGYPKRPLQQSFDTTVEDSKMWLFWGRPQIPVEERPPVPGSRADALEGMVSTTVSNVFETQHQNTMDVIASEKSLEAIARTFLGAERCSVEAAEEVEESWASRTVTYNLTPTKTQLSPLVPQGLPEAIKVTVAAQLPSSVVTTFHLSQGRCLRLEAHVVPEKYETSRLTITAHQNFAGWAATGPFVRDMLTTVSEGIRNRAERIPVKRSPETRPFHVDTSSEKLLAAFTSLRVEFNSLGYGVPAEIAAAPHRVDM